MSDRRRVETVLDRVAEVLGLRTDEEIERLGFRGSQVVVPVDLAEQLVALAEQGGNVGQEWPATYDEEGR